jgi:hypothetical protein
MTFNYKTIILFIISIQIITGCATTHKVIQPKSSSLKLRTMQSHNIDIKNIKHIMSVLIQLLQDDNYTIDNIDSGAGYFKASTTITGDKASYKFNMVDIIFYPVAIYKASTLGNNINTIIATGSVRRLGGKSSVRISFKMITRDPDGEIIKTSTIEDPIFYQRLFSKLDKAVFLDYNDL